MKLKTKKELLADFKKANKVRKLYLANRAGFDTADEYLNHLVKQVEVEDSEEVSPQPEVSGNTERLKVHIVNILDVSTSMTWGGKLDKALEGLNSEVSEFKNDAGVDYLYTLVRFSSSVMKDIDKKDINTVGIIKSGTIGTTALYDAVGKTLTELLNSVSKGEKTVVKIFTDGEENCSKYFTASKVSELVESCKANDITVTFVGTANDVNHVVRNLKIDASNTLSHDNTARGVADSFTVNMQATRSYVAKAKAGEDTITGFYKQSGTL